MITVSTQDGVKGTITLDGDRLTGSTSATQRIAENTLKRMDPAMAYHYLAAQSNGYTTYHADDDGHDVTKCLSCGCGKPHDTHGDEANITLEDVQAAGTAAKLPPGQAASNIADYFRAKPDADDKPTAKALYAPKWGRHDDAWMHELRGHDGKWIAGPEHQDLLSRFAETGGVSSFGSAFDSPYNATNDAVEDIRNNNLPAAARNLRLAATMVPSKDHKRFLHENADMLDRRAKDLKEHPPPDYNEQAEIETSVYGHPMTLESIAEDSRQRQHYENLARKASNDDIIRWSKNPDQAKDELYESEPNLDTARLQSAAKDELSRRSALPPTAAETEAELHELKYAPFHVLGYDHAQDAVFALREGNYSSALRHLQQTRDAMARTDAATENDLAFAPGSNMTTTNARYYKNIAARNLPVLDFLIGRTQKAAGEDVTVPPPPGPLGLASDDELEAELARRRGTKSALPETELPDEHGMPSGVLISAAKLAEINSVLNKRGNAQTLRDYWTGHGHGGPTHHAFEHAIAWGTPGDFMRCVAQLTAHGKMSPEQAKGYCNLRHHEALGYWPAQHARMDRGKAVSTDPKAPALNDGYLEIAEQQPVVKAAWEHELRGHHGEWTRGAVAEAIRPITADEARGDSRPVSHEEFQRIAHAGQAKLDKMRAERSPAEGLERNWTDLKHQAYQETRFPWGGMTVDSHTGKPLETDADKYALSVKPQGMKSVSVREDASEPELAAAMDHAIQQFRDELEPAQAHLGVFHDDENHRIDIDPVVVVDSLDDVEQIGAAAHSIGGAYHFASGDGYWPPHVADPEKAERKRPHFRGPGEWRSQAEELQHRA